MPHRSGKRRRSDHGYWSTSTILSTLFLEFFGAIFLLTTVALVLDGREIWEVAACFLFAVLLVLIPVGGYYLRHRAIAIAGPRIVVRDGTPAVAFPADHRAITVSAVAYAIVAAVLLCFSMNAPAFASTQMLVLGLPALFFLSYPLFALTGRLVDDGTYLTEHGVGIRARGLRAELPWSSIAGSHTVAGLPWQFPRIVIELHPGSPRDVQVTVPWWIGSPGHVTTPSISQSYRYPASRLSCPNQTRQYGFRVSPRALRPQRIFRPSPTLQSSHPWGGRPRALDRSPADSGLRSESPGPAGW